MTVIEGGRRHRLMATPARVALTAAGAAVAVFCVTAALSRRHPELAARTSLSSSETGSLPPAPIRELITLGEVRIDGIVDEEPVATESAASSTADAFIAQQRAPGSDPSVHANAVLANVIARLATDAPEDWFARSEPPPTSAIAWTPAQVDPRNARVVKRANFMRCGETSPGESVTVDVRVLVDPAGRATFDPIAEWPIPAMVVSCVSSRVGSLPLIASPTGGSRSFDRLSSHSPELL